VASGQPTETFIKSFDPNPQSMFQADKGTNIWSIGNYVYVTNGYINAQGGGSQQIFKINADTREIVKQIAIEGPQGDLGFSERGGFWISSDQHILITGQWYDYNAGVTRAVLTKLNKDLDIIWTNYFTDIPNMGLYGDGVTETEDGNYLIYLTEALDPVPHTMAQIRIIKTDTSGNLLFSKILVDTFDVSAGYGDITPTDNGNYLLSSVVLDYYYHPGRQGTVLFMLDAEANPIWSRVLDFRIFNYQEGISTSLAGGGGAVMWMKDTLTNDPEIAWDFLLMYGIDSNGNRTWTHEWNKWAYKTVYRIKQAGNGDILGVGFHKRGGPTKGKSWLFRMTNTGELLWERLYSDSLLRPWSPQLELLDIYEMADGRIAATGIVFDTNTVGLLNPNVVVLVLDQNGCLEPGCPDGIQYITSALEPIFKLPDLPCLVIAPNPSSSYNPITVTLPEELGSSGNFKYELRCYDLQGRLVLQANWPKAESAMEIRDAGWESGAYHLVLFARNQPVASGKIIIQH